MATLEGGAYDDVLFGSRFSDIIFAHAGNDTVFGDNGDDTIFGEAGNDTLFGDADRPGDVGLGGEEPGLEAPGERQVFPRLFRLDRLLHPSDRLPLDPPLFPRHVVGDAGRHLAVLERFQAGRDPRTAVGNPFLVRREDRGDRAEGLHEEQVEAWAALGPSAAQIGARSRDGRTTLVAVDERDRPVVFGDLEQDGHIGYLCARQRRPARASPRRCTIAWSRSRARVA